MKSALNWVGGKSRLSKDIVNIMPEHKTYVEVFGGALWVLFNKPKVSVEAVNDIDSELINFWAVVQKDYEAFKEKFQYVLPSRDLFNYYLKQDLNTLSDLDRAVRFFYINRTCFGGNMVDSPNFGSRSQRRSNLCIVTDDFDKFMKPIFERLKDVYIENLDFRKIIAKFNSSGTKEESDVLFYLDPPYVNMRGYSTKFIKQDHVDLSEILRRINSKFILSINNDPFILDLYKGFNLVHKNVVCKIAKENHDIKDRKELIITNY